MLTDLNQWLFLLGLFLAATLYSSVGHAGASAYLALMALAGVPQAVMKPTALVLNIIVSVLVSIRFKLAGAFRWRVLWPFLIGAVPLAYFGGHIQLPGHFYKPLVGVILLVAAARLLWPKPIVALQTPSDPPIVPAIACGALIGLLSGLTGTGGGIFLSPLILFLGWGQTRTVSGVAAVFILCNSLAGLAGNFASVGELPPQLPFYAAAVLAGALLGSQMGSIKLPREMILKALGAVLVIAGGKLILVS
jgi:uncharacterized protein